MLSGQWFAEVAELADAHGSGPCGSNTLRVRLPSSAFFIKRFRDFAKSLFCFIGNYIFYVEKLPAECIGDEGNEKRKEMEKN